MFGPALCSPSRGIGALTDLTTQGFQRERQPAPYKSMLCENLRWWSCLYIVSEPNRNLKRSPGVLPHKPNTKPGTSAFRELQLEEEVDDLVALLQERKELRR